MSEKIDKTDRQILDILQKDSTASLEAMSENLNISRNTCWRRVKHLEKSGFITGRVARLDAEKLDLGLTVFVNIRTINHEPDWLSKFAKTIQQFPEIMSAYRMSGDLDYVLRVVVKDVRAYDDFYQRLIKEINLGDVSASFVMEAIVDTNVLPLAKI